jgi:hypothetical protein
MEIKDFLPSYPSIDDPSFYSSIYEKKEFYDLKLAPFEGVPSINGDLMKHQKFISRFLAPETMYNRLLLTHEMGTGKSCSAIGAIEMILDKVKNAVDLNDKNSFKLKPAFTGAIIIASGNGLLRNFTGEIALKCTDGQYIPDGFDGSMTKIRTVLRPYYSFYTFYDIAKQISSMSANDIDTMFGNKVIVIDEVHGIKEEDIQKEIVKKKGQAYMARKPVKTYKNIWKLLHTARNTKIILLTGTPMKDTPEEISASLNLLLPRDNQMPIGKEFVRTFIRLDAKNQQIGIKKRKKLKSYFKGLISFLKAPSTGIQKRFIGKNISDIMKYNNIIGRQKHFKLYVDEMSSFQSAAYIEAYTKDKFKGKKSGVYANSSQASLFVFPDGSYGSSGLDKYIPNREGLNGKKRRIMSNNFKNCIMEGTRGLKGDEKHEIMLSNIHQYSSKYADAIRIILNSDKKCCFVHGRLVAGSGIILFSKLLNFFGFGSAGNKLDTKKKRFALFEGSTTKKYISRINDRFNMADNVYGEYIQVIIGGIVVSQGYSFNHVQKEFILTPHWNYSEIDQAIARGIRIGSHDELATKLGYKPGTDIYLMCAIADGGESIDLDKYRSSEDKDVIIKRMMRLMMQSSVDCALNYDRNYREGYDDRQECDYTNCSYKCDGIGVVKPLSQNQLDYQTYQLFYFDPRMTDIKRDLTEIIQEFGPMTPKAIWEILERSYSIYLVNGLLPAITDGDPRMMITEDIIKNKLITNQMNKLIDRIKSLFREKNSHNLDEILRKNKKFSLFEVVKTLDYMINDSVQVKDRYGFTKYLSKKEEMYKLSDISGTLEKEIVIDSSHPFEYALREMVSGEIPGLIDALCKGSDEYKEILKKLPSDIIELLIENVVVAKKRKTKKGNAFRNIILAEYGKHVQDIDGFSVSSYLGRENLRCMNKNLVWANCSKKMISKISDLKGERLNEMKGNQFGVAGAYNEILDKFCIMDLSAVDKKDSRKNKVGSVCNAGGWNLTRLVEIMMRLGVPAPDEFKVNDPFETLDDISKASIKNNVKCIDKKNVGDVRRLIYWGKKKKAEICVAIRKKLTDENLMIIDDNCGSQKKKRKDVKKSNGKNVYVTTVVKKAENDMNRFNSMTKGNNPTYKIYEDLGYDDEFKMANTLVYVFKKTPNQKPLVGMLLIDTTKENILAFAVRSKGNYSNKDIFKEIFEAGVKHIQDQGVIPVGYPESKDMERIFKEVGMKHDSDGYYTLD